MKSYETIIKEIDQTICQFHDELTALNDDIADHPLMVERVATMPDPVITQPNYAIEPCEAALRAADAAALQNLGEI